MRENRTSGSMRRGERRVMVFSADGHRPERAETVGRRRTCTRPRSSFTLPNACSASYAPPHPALSPSGGEGTENVSLSLGEGEGRGEGGASVSCMMRARKSISKADQERLKQ